MQDEDQEMYNKIKTKMNDYTLEEAAFELKKEFFSRIPWPKGVIIPYDLYMNPINDFYCFGILERHHVEESYQHPKSLILLSNIVLKKLYPLYKSRFESYWPNRYEIKKRDYLYVVDELLPELFFKNSKNDYAFGYHLDYRTYYCFYDGNGTIPTEEEFLRITIALFNREDDNPKVFNKTSYISNVAISYLYNDEIEKELQSLRTQN